MAWLLVGLLGAGAAAQIGFSVGRVSEGQFEYQALNRRTTPRYEYSGLARIIVMLFSFQRGSAVV